MREDRVAVAEVVNGEESVRVAKDEYDWNGNGNGNGSWRSLEYGVERGSENGALELEVYVNGNGGATNGSLVKYEGEKGEVGVDKEEKKRKRRVEEIGQEDAWFKKSGGETPQVCSF